MSVADFSHEGQAVLSRLAHYFSGNHIVQSPERSDVVHVTFADEANGVLDASLFHQGLKAFFGEKANEICVIEGAHVTVTCETSALLNQMQDFNASRAFLELKPRDISSEEGVQIDLAM